MYFDATQFEVIADELINQIITTYGTDAVVTMEQIKEEGEKLKNLTSNTYKIYEIDQTVEIIRTEIDVERADIYQLRNFVEEYKEKYLKRTGQKGKSMLREVWEHVLSILQDMIIFFFTILIVITLRFRSIIKTEHLYQSEPERFPYMFYDTSACIGEDLNDCYGIVSSLDDNERYEPFKPIMYQSVEEISQVNKSDLSLEDVFDVTSSVYNEFDKETKLSYIKKNFPISVGKNVQEAKYDGVKKLDSISKQFINEVKKQNIDDLSTYSLILYATHHIIYNTQKVLGSLHDNVFKNLTNTNNQGYFALAIILVFAFLKSFSTRANRIIEGIFVAMAGKGNLALQGIITLASSFFIPFIAFILFLFPIFYILSLVFSLTAYYKFNSVANTFMMTKLMCLSGIMFSVVSLIGVLMIFGAFIAYLIAPKTVKGMASGKKEEKKDKVALKEEKIAKMDKKKIMREGKVNDKKLKLASGNLKKSKRKKIKRSIKRNNDRANKKKRKIKRKTNKMNNRKKRRDRSGFKDKCDNNSFSTAALWGSAGGLVLFISLVNFVPLSVSFVSAALMSIRMAYDIATVCYNILNDVQEIMKKNKIVLIITFLLLIIISQLIKVFDELKKADRKYNDVGGIITIILTNFIVLFIAGLLMKSMGGGKVENVNDGNVEGKNENTFNPMHHESQEELERNDSNENNNGTQNRNANAQNKIT